MSYAPSAPRLGFTSVGTRIRKPLGYQRHYTPKLQAILETGDLIYVVPSSDFGYYVIRPDTMPELLPQKTYNLAVPFTTFIPALNPSTGPTSPDFLVKNFDVQRGEIAHYRISVFDPNINIKLAQPSGITRFADKTGTRLMNAQDTLYFATTGQWGGVAEFWTFQDNTPVTLTVQSATPNENTYWARVLVTGYKYQLIKVRPRNARAEPRIVVTIDVGQRQK